MLLSFLISLSQAYRAYSGDFKRLTDIVRCCLVMDTTEDMLRLVEVSFFRHKVQSIVNELHGTSQKILDNSEHVDASKKTFMERISLWWKNYFLQKVLGLKHVNITNQGNAKYNTDQPDESAFQLLRV